MLIVINSEDFEDPDLFRTYLQNMQAESDEAWQEDPEDGEGSLKLRTPHAGINARIVGILHERDFHNLGQQAYEVHPIRGETG
jgi:hypothetical protein